MAIVSGYQKMKDYIKQSSGYKLLSRWANANTVECDDAQTVQSKIGGITGISSSLTANSSTQAASTQLTNQLYQNMNQLSSELYQETTETNSMNLVDAVNFICNNLELQKSFRKVFQCLNGWYSLDTIKSSGGVCSGFLSSLTTSEAYSFYKGGADAVLKKLGNATITFTTELHGSGWAATRIVKPDGYSKVDVNLSRGSGSVYGYKPDDSGTPYGTVLGTLTTAVQTFDVSEYTEIGIRVDGNNSNAKTVFY